MEKRNFSIAKKVDVFIQRVIMVIWIMTAPTIIFAFYWAIVVGFYQVTSGIIGAIGGSRWRQIYIAVVIFYFGTVATTMNFFEDDIMVSIASIYAVIAPFAIGMFYYIKSEIEAKSVAQRKVFPSSYDDGDIIDADFVRSYS